MKIGNNIKALNKAIDKTIEAIEDGKTEIFELSEQGRKDQKRIEDEFIEIKTMLKDVISQVDHLELMEQESRKQLLEVSQNFQEYDESSIKKAYERANNLQVQLTLYRKEEKELFRKRTELEIRLKDSKEFLKRAEVLTSKVGIALKYLSDNVSEQIEDIKQKKAVTYKILEAQEQERQRVSREIHDGPAQSIANMIIKSEYCERALDIETVDIKSELYLLKDTARVCLKDIRKIIFDLLPMSLTDLGLIPTVKSITEDLRRDMGIMVDFQVEATVKIDNKLIKLTIFRIIQEIISNVKKHSKCTEFVLRIYVDGDIVKIYAADNGKGFSFDQEEYKPDMSRGFGLYNINERVELLDGEIFVSSRVGEGTKYRITLPIGDEEGVINE